MRNHHDIKSTHPWIDKTKFEPQSQATILQQVITRVRSEHANRIQNGGKPVHVVFDLDSTIFDVKPRTLRIIKEFALTKQARELSPTLSDWGLTLKAHKLAYTLRESAEQNGFPYDERNAESYMKALFAFWKDRFFNHSYVLADHPSLGAVDYVRAVCDAGAHVVYLTGRDEPGMGRGTRTALEHWGFPLDGIKHRLILKPYFGMDDSEFKDQALADLRSHCDVAALFDNEPANFYVFEKNFPEALLIFFHSTCSQKEARAVNKIYRINDFLLS